MAEDINSTSEKRTFESFMKNGRLIRETAKSNWAMQASTNFDTAISMAVGQGWWEDAIKGGLELCLIPYLQWVETQNLNYLELMYTDLLTAEHIADRFGVFSDVRATLDMRFGQYYQVLRKNDRALDFYSRAQQSSEDVQNNPEIMSPYGLALALTGKAREGIQILEGSLENARHRTYDDWHRLIVLSGIHLRLAEALAVAGNSRDAFVQLELAKTMASTLCVEHEMPWRSKQAEIAEKRLNELMAF